MIQFFSLFISNIMNEKHLLPAKTIEITTWGDFIAKGIAVGLDKFGAIIQKYAPALSHTVCHMLLPKALFLPKTEKLKAFTESSMELLCASVGFFAGATHNDPKAAFLHASLFYCGYNTATSLDKIASWWKKD